MKIFAVKDERADDRKTLAWLIYYEQSEQFCIELPDGADLWETPLLLSSFLKKGEHTINSYWSKVWVQQRIIPTDRQNLGQILKDNGLSRYDEFGLLMLTSGRCPQDDYYLEPLKNSSLPKELLSRFEKKIDDIIPLTGRKLLVFFRNGAVKKVNIERYMDGRHELAPVLENDEYFMSVYVSAGGNEAEWGTGISIPASILYDSGIDIPLSKDDLLSFVQNRVINSAEAAEMLNCSRQNIDDLIRRGKLHPIKTNPKNKLFLKSEIEQRCCH